jgi:uncharacterized lipoprotein YbaY
MVQSGMSFRLKFNPDQIGQVDLAGLNKTLK